MQDILDLILSNKIYMIATVVVGLGLLIFLMKKVFKLFLLVVFIALGYAAFIYMTEDDPMKVIQQKMDSGKNAIEDIDDVTKDIRREAIDKVIDDVDKKLKEAGKKKK